MRIHVKKCYFHSALNIVPLLSVSVCVLCVFLRWIKFEEKVEKGGERWSKPHVATLSLHSLFQLKNCIEKGTIKLDMEANSLQQIVGKTAL